MLHHFQRREVVHGYQCTLVHSLKLTLVLFDKCTTAALYQCKLTAALQALIDTEGGLVSEESPLAVLVNDKHAFLHVVKKFFVAAAGQLRTQVGEAYPGVEDMHQSNLRTYPEEVHDEHQDLCRDCPLGIVDQVSHAKLDVSVCDESDEHVEVTLIRQQYKIDQRFIS